MNYTNKLFNIINHQDVKGFEVLHRLVNHITKGTHFDIALIEALSEDTRLLVIGALSEKYLQTVQTIIFQKSNNPFVNQKTFTDILKDYGHNFDTKKLSTYYKRGKLPTPDLMIENKPYWYETTANYFASSLPGGPNYYEQDTDKTPQIHIDIPNEYIVKKIPGGL